MNNGYTSEKNVQVILSLLKYRGIRRVIASPGTTNMAFVASVHHDKYFEVYSAADERSAAYIACGLAAETREPVVLSCTEATASRNYLPGMTEAYYRKLPILVITSAKIRANVGQHIPQVIDQSVLPKDAAKLSVALPVVKDDDDLWECELKMNNAILELFRHGGGPVHVHLPTSYSRSFELQVLPTFRVIDRITQSSIFPELPEGRIAVFVGSNIRMSVTLIATIDKFCEINDAVVFCDHTSGYTGRFRLLFSLVSGQESFDYSRFIPNLLICIGEISGDYYSYGLARNNVWRVSEDGEIRDTFRALRRVFEMPEQAFFSHYSTERGRKSGEYLLECQTQLNDFQEKVPELPFSNLWVASKIASLIPEGSAVHFGILNSLRSWNFFELPKSVSAFANVGGFGIDGGVSALLGASLSDPNKLFFGVIGDLAFFYDMNALGNRHVGNNLRILMVNNGKGIEFRNYNHHAIMFSETADEFIAAAGHYGNKSHDLAKHYVQDLGFEYFSANNKEEFNAVYQQFVNPNFLDKPLFMEVFTETEDESNALQMIKNMEKNTKGTIKQIARKVLGEKKILAIKKAIGR